MNKRVRKTFNDGYLEFGQRKTIRTKGKKTGTEFRSDGKLAFNELSVREQDYQLADLSTSRIDLKVETLYPPFFKKTRKTKMKVLIDGTEFDVIKVDSDYNKNFLYFYLQEVGDVM